MNENEENIDEIRRDIEDTRQRISSEIDAIEEKMTPAHAREVLKDKVVEARSRVADRIDGAASMVKSEASRVRGDFGEAVRTNPVPVALIGIGAGWLVWETLRPSSRRELIAEPLIDVDVEYDVEPDYATGAMGPIPERMRTDGHRAERARERASNVASKLRGRAAEARRNASELASDARGRASRIASDAKSRASGLASDARERGRHVAERGREQALRARDKTSDAYESSPLVFGAIAAAVGLAMGVALPRTSREDRLLGPARERAIERARRMADEAKNVAIDSLREGAEAARETAKREAHERHLMP